MNHRKLIADLSDLVTFAGWAQTVGLDSVWIGPIVLMGVRGEMAPYTPESRCFIDPLYLPSLGKMTLDEAPGACPEALDPYQFGLRRRREVALSHLEATEVEITSSPYYDDEATERICDLVTPAHLDLLAQCYYSLAYQQGPADVQLLVSLRRQVAMSQAVGHGALRVANELVRLFLDLPIGVLPGGVDAMAFSQWCIEGGRLGAPPDYFNPDGQSWGLTGFDLGKNGSSRGLDFTPISVPIQLFAPVSTGLRIDHAIGLQRLCVVQDEIQDFDFSQKTYFLDQPRDEILSELGVIAKEHNLILIAEDLGVVPEGLRRALSEAEMLLTKVLCFENESPSDLETRVLVSFTTHDTPTARQLLSSDCGGELELESLRIATSHHLVDHGKLVLGLSAEFMDFLLQGQMVMVDVDSDNYIGDVVPRMVQTLLQFVAKERTISLRDLVGECDRLNVPGTGMSERCNFFRPLGKIENFLDQLCQVRVLFEVQQALGG